MYRREKAYGYFRSPGAVAEIRGSRDYKGIRGEVQLYQMEQGVFVAAEIRGLPTTGGSCGNDIFAFHIHMGGSCTGNAEDPFADAFTHYNPDGCMHPHHAGDLPPLFGNGGYALMGVLTNRFSLEEVIGKTIVIHLEVDDFVTQPAGNAGTRIACGEIKPAVTF